MTKDLIRSLFSMNDDEFLKLVNNATKFVKKLEEDINTEVNDDDENTESYFHSSAKEYNNGNLVKKSEKEYVNGECTKDEEFDATKELSYDDTKDEGKQCKCAHKSRLYHKLKMENDSLKSQIDDMTHYIDSLNDRIKELDTENEKLSQVVNNVKSCFLN
jgi:flagellin-like hook-associated protein FlgL